MVKIFTALKKMLKFVGFISIFIRFEEAGIAPGIVLPTEETIKPQL